MQYITKEVLDKLDPIEYFEDYREEYGNNQQPTAQNQQEEKLNIDSEDEDDPEVNLQD